MLFRSLLYAGILAGIWWYGRWLLRPPAELAFDQSILLAGIIVILFIAYATLAMTLLSKLADRWSAGVLDGKAADVGKLLLSFSSLLFLATFLLLSISDVSLGIVSVFSVSFLFAILRETIRGRLVS